MNETRYTAIVAALREEFPKANKGTVSMALHTNDYGVKFCTRAQEIYDAVIAVDAIPALMAKRT